MIFYLGTHQPAWLAHAGVPLFVSRRRLADPPCTPWSRADKRKELENARDLLAETCEVIKLLRPRAYLIGNVPGLQDGNHLLALPRGRRPARKGLAS